MDCRSRCRASKACATRPFFGRILTAVLKHRKRTRPGCHWCGLRLHTFMVLLRARVCCAKPVVGSRIGSEHRRLHSGSRTSGIDDRLSSYLRHRLSGVKHLQHTVRSRQPSRTQDAHSLSKSFIGPCMCVLFRWTENFGHGVHFTHVYCAASSAVITPQVSWFPGSRISLCTTEVLDRLQFLS